MLLSSHLRHPLGQPASRYQYLRISQNIRTSQNISEYLTLSALHADAPALGVACLVICSAWAQLTRISDRSSCHPAQQRRAGRKRRADGASELMIAKSTRTETITIVDGAPPRTRGRHYTPDIQLFKVCCADPAPAPRVAWRHPGMLCARRTRAAVRIYGRVL
eukprot:SAG31_NODE_1222_length_9294_cov_4.099184_8_plen_163_part_00